MKELDKTKKKCLISALAQVRLSAASIMAIDNGDSGIIHAAENILTIKGSFIRLHKTDSLLVTKKFDIIPANAH